MVTRQTDRQTGWHTDRMQAGKRQTDRHTDR